MLGAGVAGVADVVSVGSGCYPAGEVLWRSVWVPMAVLMWVLQLLVLGLGVVGWVLLGVGARHSWLRVWWVYPCVLAVFLAALQLPWRGLPGSRSFGFRMCVRLWCGRCLRFGVCRASVGLVSVVAVAVCVACTRGRVCGVLVVRLGACPRLSGLGLAARCGCGGCVPWPLSRPGCGVRVSFPATPGWGLLAVVCPPVAPFVPPPPLFPSAASLRAVFPWWRARVFPAVVGWGGGVASRWLRSLPLVFPLGGADTCTPRQGVTLL